RRGHPPGWPPGRGVFWFAGPPPGGGPLSLRSRIERLIHGPARPLRGGGGGRRGPLPFWRGWPPGAAPSRRGVLLPPAPPPALAPGPEGDPPAEHAGQAKVFYGRSGFHVASFQGWKLRKRLEASEGIRTPAPIIAEGHPERTADPVRARGDRPTDPGRGDGR